MDKQTDIHINTMSENSTQITKKLLTEIQFSDVQKWKLLEYRNTNKRSTKMQIREIQNLKLHKSKWEKKYQKFRNINHRNTDIQITEIHIYQLHRMKNIE